MCFLVITSYSHDKHGNITGLTRYGQTTVSGYGVVDNLTLEYNGTNQLRYIQDNGANVALNISSDFKDYKTGTTQEYGYNANGSMTYDHNRGISEIAYNQLGMPLRTDIKSPVAEARNQYTYTASGAKLRTVSSWNSNYSYNPVIGSTVNVNALNQQKTTDYVGNIEYENGVVKKILTNNGYYENNNYYFYLRDHLGSNVMTANHQGNITQQNHYYPFGTTMSISTNQGLQSYKFSDKELSMEHGLNLYDFHARTYDPATGRFLSIDPMAEKYYNISPYAYCANNPMRYIDPTGKDIVIAGNEEYQKKIVTFLHQLFNSGDAGKLIVGSAIESDRTFVIANVKGEMAIVENKNASILIFDLDEASGTFDPANGDVEHNPVTNLAHEITHFNNPRKGTLLNTKGQNTRVSEGEVKAVEMENAVRGDLNMDVRKKYRGIDVYGKEIEESSKYKGYYNLKNKEDYGKVKSSDYRYDNVKQYRETRVGPYYNGGSYIQFKTPTQSQIRLKFNK